MANKINYDFRTGRTYCSSDGIIGKPLEIYMNLQSPEEIARLEEELRLVLQKKTEFYKKTEEHAGIFADFSTTRVKSYITPGKKEPVEGDYPTLFVYQLACDYNITERNMAVINSGGQLDEDPETTRRRKMDLVAAGASE